MVELDGIKVLILVFALPGCGACEEHIPRLARQIEGFQKYGHPFAFHAPNRRPVPGEILVCIYDSNSDDPGLQQLLDQYDVDAMPTTVLLTRGGFVKLVGALDEPETYKLLASAVEYNQ